MTGFKITTTDGITIRFRYYKDEAPETVTAFEKTLPFSKMLFQARVSGEEIWTDDAPVLDVPQENASVFTKPGEAVIGPLKPLRTKTGKCLGIYYGEGKGLDACNIFAIAFEEDMPALKTLGENIWRSGESKLVFENL